MRTEETGDGEETGKKTGGGRSQGRRRRRGGDETGEVYIMQ